jgi:GrpB-like predicted nucleotidyltransferase (UPF0157 family)
MRKKLSEMSKEELWKLFPIIIREHDPHWSQNFEREKSFLEQLVSSLTPVDIHHIGSTAVPGLKAKPTVDILMEIADETDLERFRDLLTSNGYIFCSKPENPPPSMMFMKGYTEKGFADDVYHLHVRYRGDWDELYFRDFLLSHPGVAGEYEELKLELQKRYEYDRDAYTEGKTEFIRRYTLQARKELETVRR